MRSACKLWPARLVSTVATLALVLASAIGAFGHAAAHGHNAVVPHASHMHAAHVQGAAETGIVPDHLDLGHADHRGGSDSPCHSHTYCCDTFCHGGQAILAATPVLPPPAPATSFVRRPDLAGGRTPGCLDRPPRPPVLA
jgi:hypothetical protein